MAMNSSFTALPDDVLQRVLVGVLLDDHPATAAACQAFRAVIRGPRFLRLRREYGFAERRILLVAHSDHEGPLEIRVPGKPRIVAASIPELRIDFGGTTTDGGARLFVTTTRRSGAPLVLKVDASARRWSRFATLPLSQSLHCMEWHGGLLYVAGGVGGDNSQSINTFQAFNEATGSWEDLPPMPYACALAISGVIGNELFVAGGIGNNFDLSTLQIYDFTARTWRLGAPLPHTQWGECGVVVGDGKLYLVRIPGTTRRMMVYDVQSNTWTEQQGPPYERTAGVVNAFAHNGCIVALNGAGSAFQRGTGSDWSRFDLADVRAGENAVAGSVLLG